MQDDFSYDNRRDRELSAALLGLSEGMTMHHIMYVALFNFIKHESQTRLPLAPFPHVKTSLLFVKTATCEATHIFKVLAWQVKQKQLAHE
ncbi:hypothetical protein ACJX0J_014326, partial [Zea mays]